MTETKFTWLPKFTQTLLSVPEEHQATLFRALALYGNYGEEPEFDDWALKAVFEALREDIDNNKNFRKAGSTGGRGNKKPENPSCCQAEGLEDAETPLCDDATPLLEISGNAETPSEVGFEKAPSIPYQSIPNQSIPDQPKGKGRRFTPPTAEEVAAYCSEKGYTFSPEAFTAFYESNGWRVGKNPMKSWKAACSTWQQREEPRKGGAHDEYSDL